ncbi:S-adenosyl-L-methionine-dependent methyltransferase [Lentinula aff. detonsa]|nr:S-adenosyl-L-methionine-dependent methyltransferase [Lentinula aff. detonsa]
MSTIQKLVQMIDQAVKDLEDVCMKDGLTVPDLSESFTLESEAFRENPAAFEATNIAVAAALQLVAHLMPPTTSLAHAACGHYKSACLRICAESNIAEILRESGSQGLHLDSIAKQSGIERNKLSLVLRYLATHNIFREVIPDVFTHTRISSVMDTGKSLKELQASPDTKHDNTLGLAALVEYVVDEVAKSSAYGYETIKDPITGPSREPHHTPLNRAFGTTLPTYDWYELPENAYRLRRFGAAMKGMSALQPSDVILGAYDWSSLEKGALVVDVGGGIGTSTLALYNAFPQFKYIVQDRPPIITQAIEACKKENPKALESGCVKFQVHDFFMPQQQSATVFLLKLILHDYSDANAFKILSALRMAATPSTILLSIDSLMAYACHVPDSHVAVPGATAPEAPAPLLANWGPVADNSYIPDLTMFFAVGGQERTLGHAKSLLEKSGWKLIRVNRGEGNFTPTLVAKPIQDYKL